MYAFVDRLARLMALLGGAVLLGLVLMVCLSIAGRTVAGLTGGWLGAIPGDFEIVESGMAFAIFAFLPLCPLNGAHASVDVFTSALPLRANRVLRAVIEILFAAVLILIFWQLWEGMESKRRSGQTTLLLQFPVWWAYAASLTGAAAAALISVYVAAMRMAEAWTGRAILPAEVEADH